VSVGKYLWQHQETYLTCLKISADKTKIMVFKGKDLVRSKTEIDGSILEQVKQFNYLGCELNLDSEPYFDKRNK